MNKITFMGAGSTVFVRNVLGDCMCSDALKDWEYALYDIDATRLEESFEIISAMNETKGGHARITKHLGVENRKEALRGARFVVNAIQVGLYDPCTIIDFEVPKKYGLRQTIGDTLGIGGIMQRPAHHPRDGRFCQRHAGSMPGRAVPELYQPHGYAQRLYAALYGH